MTPIIEDSVLGTDLNCDWHDLLNCNAIIPAPVGLVGDDDPRLYDARTPIPGSVVDASCAVDAGIVQSKLALNGQIPASWLGTGAGQAAPGNLAEYLTNKNQPLGYCGLDGTAKVPPAQLPGTVGTGTVTSVGLSMPPQFAVTGSPVTQSGVISSAWAVAADLSWFGNKEGVAGQPKFYSTPFPDALIPDLDASKVTSGVFDPARLPIAIGVGEFHAAGACPDPGTIIGIDPPEGMAPAPIARPDDYLARDMTYKRVPVIGPTYQPVVPNPTLTIGQGPPYPVTITDELATASLFYSLDNPNSGFAPIAHGGQVLIYPGHIVYAYGSRVGYTNSAVVNIPAPYAPPDELVVTGDPVNPNEVVTGDDSANVTVGGPLGVST